MSRSCNAPANLYSTHNSVLTLVDAHTSRCPTRVCCHTKLEHNHAATRQSDTPRTPQRRSTRHAFLEPASYSHGPNTLDVSSRLFCAYLNRSRIFLSLAYRVSLFPRWVPRYSPRQNCSSPLPTLSRDLISSYLTETPWIFQVLLLGNGRGRPSCISSAAVASCLRLSGVAETKAKFIEFRYKQHSSNPGHAVALSATRNQFGKMAEWLRRCEFIIYIVLLRLPVN